MPLLNEEVQEQVREQLSDLAAPVRLVMLTQEFECQYCAETRQLVEEVADLSDQLQAEIHDFVDDKDIADEYNIDKIPAVAVVGEKDHGVRFFGE
mgnify:CR=1 FL=1